MALAASSPGKALIVKVALACIFFTVLTLAKTYPLIRHLGTDLPGDLGDPLLVTWILAWDVHAITTDPLNLFNANIFYPLQNTLALSEHMIAVVPIFAPAYLMTGNPIFAYNIVFLLAFIFCGISMFLLVHYWTENFWAAVLSGCLFAFAPFRFAELSHLQLASFYWAPLVFLFLDKFVRHKRWADLTWFAVFYWLQMLASVYLGWMITIGVGVYLLYAVAGIDRSLLNRQMVPRYTAFIVCSLIVLLPFYLPYYAIKEQRGVSPSLQACIHWSADPLLSYLSPPHLLNDIYLSFVQSHFPLLMYPTNQQQLFPGFVIGILVALGSLASATWLLDGMGRQPKKLFGVILLASFLLSLGPFLIILGKNTGIPLPYLLFYYLFPGFQGMRVPARFALMAILAASLLAGLGFLVASNFLKSRWRVNQASAPLFQGGFALFWVVLFFLELGFKPLPLAGIQTGHQVPKVYRWLATKPFSGAIVELPLGQEFWQTLKYMYFSTYHWLPLVNGTSGYTPAVYKPVTSNMAALPSRQAAEVLGAMGVQGVVVHTDQLAPPEAARWHRANLADAGLQEIARFGADVVYALSPVGEASRLHVGLAISDQPPTAQVLRLPAGAMMRFGFLAENGGPGPWVHPPPLGRTSAVITWEEVRTGKKLLQREYLELPLAISAEDVWSTGIPVSIPRSPGRYRVSIVFPALGLEAAPKLLQVVSGAAQTSANASQRLSAAYLLEGPASQTITSNVIEVTLNGTNIGESVWLADTPDDRGEVRLGWRWYRNNEGTPFREGREQLPYDVFPGQAYKFRTTIQAPLEPGEYTLELGLVCELLTWFSNRGVPPFTFAVRVGDSTKPSPH